MRCIVILLAAFSLCGHSQITQISTGSNATLIDLSAIGSNIMISGFFDYLAKSNDACNTLVPLAIPGPVGYATKLFRIDTNILYLASYTPSQKLIYKSTDGGYSWTQKLDTTGDFGMHLGFFNSSDGMISHGNKLLKTNDGGNTWATVNTPVNFPYPVTTFQTFGDSMICIGDGDSDFYLSKNRGNTWPYGWGIGGGQNAHAIEFFFLSKDTIFGISSTGIWGGTWFTRTFNGGNTWQNFPSPLHEPAGIFFKQANEGYFVGKDNQNNGVIAKTTNLGQTWSHFNTGIKTTLLNMAILNDSIAILTGTGGVLLKWNYTNTVFTGLNEKQPGRGMRLFPNPVTHELQFSNSSGQEGYFNISIRNTIGQVVYSDERSDLSEPLEVSHLAKGVYFISLKSDGQQKVLKFMKQ